MFGDMGIFINVGSAHGFDDKGIDRVQVIGDKEVSRVTRRRSSGRRGGADDLMSFAVRIYDEGLVARLNNAASRTFR